MENKISIIIPVYNEADHIGDLLCYLWQHGGKDIAEIIVSDGGSSDDSVTIAEQQKASVIISPKKGRAAQMNYGAGLATAPVLYFLHADTFPPPDFSQQVLHAYARGFLCGCFRLQFDHPHPFLKANCWFTRFNVRYFRFGDQSLFTAAALFKKVGGFNEKLMVLEDQEMAKRLAQQSSFKVLKGAVTTSARKYLQNGIYKTQAVYFLIYFMYHAGFPQKKLVSTYRSLIAQNKI